MKRFFRAVAKLFRRLFRRQTALALLAGIEAALPYISAAYELARMAAKATPNRTDDEIFRLADMLGVPALLQKDEDRGIAIGRIVYRALKLRYPEATDRALNRALEIAYGAVKP